MTDTLTDRREIAESGQDRPRRLDRRTRWESTARRIGHGWQLYLMLLLPVAYVIIFQYWPMYGVQIAFRNYNVVQGITGSPWVGFDNFTRFIESYQFWPVIRNTIVLQAYELVATFPLPIVLALALNYVRVRWFQRTVQMVTYAPHFISTVVIVGMLFVLLDPRIGMVNNLLGLFGISSTDFMGDPGLFRHIYVWSGVWQSLGFSAIIYLAALAGIDPELHEAAIVDGATKLKRIWHIDLPGIAPIAVILLILNIGSILSIGFEKVLLMQNNLNLSSSEVIDTYVYKVGLASDVPLFSYAAAIGLFRSVVGLVLLIAANQLARRFAKSSLW
ncbi:multiple sugar transport system permease protein/putative aldouronate transport system permease protein [Actinopolymorpha cephalotaxi]|uniref:Multiple sugar transport system permease protein/putative aldouronate transport system permease protein n=1 Tax=Actinopolymorpha cephalotaxi TaxID=504797 RepID=A0A1I3BLU4_9ACTN|nr:ABC transporter permease subunit [Actinopolymorpha cephalotaxi]NYH82859.1 multiple sugar transport system permease protein/putative aldouronate transport system permease protein [Actinopolymorpha cephalotaxi]SFH63247.1 multiple sugar transport system permease protein/putative aldouronate transport system permease protein [Actinopolymorpha cephalotaxi]